MKFETEGHAGEDAPAAHRPSGVASKPLPFVEPKLLVCFSGKIGSGKTSISRSVARWLECGRASFGGYLRDEITLRGGDPNCRKSLQDLGLSRITQDAESFCRDVLAAGGFVRGEDFVLDGVRHVAVVPHLVRIGSPSQVRLIFLEAAGELRSVRVGERSEGDWADFDRATRHLVEADMDAGLPAVADAIVDSSLREQDVFRECVGLIQRWRLPNSGGQEPLAVPKSESPGSPK
ncbi:MAG: hypothetical protein OXP74_11330 [Acidobacteriota bacterium]|nr:hypothetical protein [Acidobacteriota bacterium]